MKIFYQYFILQNSLLYGGSNNPRVLNIRSLAPDNDQDVNVSDLEISDDDDDERSI